VQREAERNCVPSPADVFSSDDLLEATGHELDLLEELRDIFGAESHRALEGIRSSAAARDTLAVARAAHKLKSGAAVVGGRAAAKLAGAIEQAALGSELDAMAHLVDELPGAIHALNEALDTFVALHRAGRSSGTSHIG
jgi:HPt (histidine-containing phosphotransfer) domain-containing protein